MFKLLGVLFFLGFCGALFLVFSPAGILLFIAGVAIKILMK